MLERVEKGLFFLLALPAVGRAAWRLRRLEGAHGLDRLTDRLRAVRPFALAYFRNPRYLAGTVDRLVLLTGRQPPGTCWRRSLLLLDLLSRSGLEPRLHLGAVETADERHLHAWLSVGGRRLGPATGHREIWSG